MLARTDLPSELLPILQQQAVQAAGGRSSILFQFDQTGRWLQATSAYAIDDLPAEPWLASDGLVPSALFPDGGPLFVADLARSIRGLATHLGTPSVLLVPLSIMDDRLGVLAVGCSAPPPLALLEEFT